MLRLESYSVLLTGIVAALGLLSVLFLLLSTPAPLPSPHAATGGWPPVLEQPLAGRFVAGLGPIRSRLPRAEPNARRNAFETFPAQGTDREGNVAFFEIMVLPGDFRWRFGSAVEVVQSNRSVDITEWLRDRSVRRILERASDVICVGAASVEGEIGGEEDRAQRRAQQVARWVAPLLARTGRVFTLNLGRYTGACRGCSWSQTAAQRRLAIIAVTARHPGGDLEQALWDALQRHESFPMDLTAYSRFDLRRYPRSSPLPRVALNAHR